MGQPLFIYRQGTLVICSRHSPHLMVPQCCVSASVYYNEINFYRWNMQKTIYWTKNTHRKNTLKIRKKYFLHFIAARSNAVTDSIDLSLLVFQLEVSRPTGPWQIISLLSQTTSC